MEIVTAADTQSKMLSLQNFAAMILIINLILWHKDVDSFNGATNILMANSVTENAINSFIIQQNYDGKFSNFVL